MVKHLIFLTLFAFLTIARKNISKNDNAIIVTEELNDTKTENEKIHDYLDVI